MDKGMAGLIGAVGALAAGTPAQHALVAPATLQAAMQADSYADLLRPIPNARALLVASAADGTTGAEEVAVGQPDVPVAHHHHHHHHHHRYHHRRRYYAPPPPPPPHHHHHHHHHHAAVVVTPGGIAVRPPND